MKKLTLLVCTSILFLAFTQQAEAGIKIFKNQTNGTVSITLVDNYNVTYSETVSAGAKSKIGYFHQYAKSITITIKASKRSKTLYFEDGINNAMIFTINPTTIHIGRKVDRSIDW